MAAIVTAALAVFWFAPHFFSLGNLGNLLRQVAMTGIIACGMTVVLLGGGFDLSVGGMAALAGVIAIQIAPHSLAGAIAASIFAGGIGGFVNGFLITSFAINPLIVTLGTRYLLYAAANLATAGFIQINRSPEFVVRGMTPPAIFLGLAAVLYFVLKYTTWGARLYAVGSNERAAAFSGIRTHRIRIQTYILCSACASLAGVVLAMRSGAAAPDAGSGYELDAIAAAVVGGVSMFGGAGNSLNTVAGVLLLGFLSNVLVLARQPYEMQRIVTGAAIVIAVGLDRYRRKGGSDETTALDPAGRLLGILSFLEKGFYRQENLLNILLQVSIDGILACGMTLVVLTSGLDLSIGSVMALSGVVFVMAAEQGVWAAGVFAAVAGLSVGDAEWVPDCTLASEFADRYVGRHGRGAGCRAVAQPRIPAARTGRRFRNARRWIFSLHSFTDHIFRDGGDSLLFAAAFHSMGPQYLCDRRQPGSFPDRANSDCGDANGPSMRSRRAWRRSPASVLASRLNTGSPIIGQDAPLQAFVAVTLGGTSLSGGKGGIAQTVLGILVLGVLSNGLNLLNVPPALQWGIKGSLLIVFAALESAPGLRWTRAAKEIA